MASGGSGRRSGSSTGSGSGSSGPGSRSGSSGRSSSGPARGGRDGARSGGARAAGNGQRGGQRGGQRSGAQRGPNPVTRGKRPAPGTRRQVPWAVIGAVTVVVLLAVGVIGFALMRNSEVSAWRPSDDNRDPSLAIPGIVTGQYAGSSTSPPSSGWPTTARPRSAA